MFLTSAVMVPFSFLVFIFLKHFSLILEQMKILPFDLCVHKKVFLISGIFPVLGFSYLHADLYSFLPFATFALDVLFVEFLLQDFFLNFLLVGSTSSVCSQLPATDL